MKFQEIQNLWQEDAKINDLELDTALLRISELQYKYHNILSSETLILHKLRRDLKSLQSSLWKYLNEGLSEEERKTSRWSNRKHPGKMTRDGKLFYIDGHPEVLDLEKKISYVETKTKYLESILKTLHNRGYNIKTALEFKKFLAGIN